MPFPEGLTLVAPFGKYAYLTGPEDKLLQFRRDVAEAEREAWDHWRGWLSLWLALLFGLAGAISTVYSTIVLRPKIDGLTKAVHAIELKEATKDIEHSSSPTGPH